jgi:hypothetical protein
MRALTTDLVGIAHTHATGRAACAGVLELAVAPRCYAGARGGCRQDSRCLGMIKDG